MKTQELYEIYKQYPKVTIDSRQAENSSIFIGIKGDKMDGNDFAEDALQKGAAYAVVDSPPTLQNNQFKNQIVQVDDSIKTLQALAAYHRSNLNIPVIGITGSNGKTTTKELLQAVLKQKFQTYATRGNLNNHLGLPLSILEILEGFELAVIEFGANHQGEHELLCKIAQPTHGLITNIGKDHLEGYGGFEGVKKAHQEFIDYLESMGGLFFENLIDPTIRSLAQNLYRVTFGPEDFKPLPHFSGKMISNFPTVSIEVTNPLKGEKSGFLVKSNLYGSYNFSNLMSAMCIAEYFGVENQSITSAIENYHPHSNRSEVIDWKGSKVILDAYNANPSSMKAAIKDFGQIQEGKKMTILGDMYELGEYSDQEHFEIIDILKEENWTKVFIGPIFSQFKKSIDGHFFECREEAKNWLSNQPLQDYWILLKGSRGMALEKLLE